MILLPYASYQSSYTVQNLNELVSVEVRNIASKAYTNAYADDYLSLPITNDYDYFLLPIKYNNLYIMSGQNTLNGLIYQFPIGIDLINYK